MKRLLPLLLLAGLFLGISTSAYAQVGQRLKTFDLSWRTQVANSSSVVDSSVFCLNGTQTTYDTTAAFPTASFELPSSVVWGGTVDTLAWFTVVISSKDGSTLTAAGLDSLIFQTQVSVDGVNWVDATPTNTFDATRTTGQANGQIIVGAASNGAIAVPITQRELLGKLSPGYAATATTITMWGWPLMRFIVNTSGGDGCFSGVIRYLTSVP